MCSVSRIHHHEVSLKSLLIKSPKEQVMIAKGLGKDVDLCGLT